MSFILFEVLFAALLAFVGTCAGWWLRGSASSPARSDEAVDAKEVLSRVQYLAARVADDVGQHNTKMHEINEELNASEETSADTVISAVTELIRANETMQRQLESAEERLHEQAEQIESTAAIARTDALTGLPNRRALDTALANIVAEPHRTGAMVMIDVDHFKKFNDTHGHQAGDEVLRGVAGTLTDVTGDAGMPARHGGEEFAVVLSGVDVENASRQADALRAAIDRAVYRFEETELHVTVSVGVSELQGGETVESWVRRADEALYASKGDGRNCGHWHDGQQSHRIVRAVEPPKEVEKAPQPSETADEAAKRKESGLAGIDARTVFFEDVHRRLSEVNRGGSTLSVALVEVDDYETIVRQRGNAAGELVLQATSHFIAETIRQMDHVARYDEVTFGLLLPSAALGDAVAVAERLRMATARSKLPLADGDLQFSVSVAVVEAERGDDSVGLLQRADKTLLNAINRGGNRTYFHRGEQPEPASALASVG